MKASDIAINSISTRQKDLEEALEAYAAAGFRNVEFHLPLVKQWIGQGHSTAEVRQLLERHSLRSIGGFEAGLDCFGAPESRGANHALHRDNARLIHELGGGTLVVGTDGPPTPSLDALAVVGAVLREVADSFEGLDVNLALEFNWSPLVKSLRSAQRACEAADHPRVGILFDPAHYYTTVSKMEHLDAGSVRWIKHVHMDDMCDKPGELSNCNSDRALPGQGILDLRSMIGRMEEHGYQGFYSMEMFSEELWALPAREAAGRCYQSLLPYCE